MTRLDELQGEIDKIDQDVISLLGDRFKRSREIGIIKRDAGAPPFDPNRLANIRTAFIAQSAEAQLDKSMADRLIGIILEQVIAERSRG